MGESKSDDEKKDNPKDTIMDEDLALSFVEDRHLEPGVGVECMSSMWRMKERMKTVSVALVLCLNVGVDPPDVVKTQPCARLECWIDPTSMSSSKALEKIGQTLQSQYERWQPRARYKQSLDPTADEVKKLCTSLRRNAKEERVLFHYNGHGVPKPTSNGEIWVFNRTYTQYIPLSIYDLQTWMGAPSIYVYDCSNAGLIVDSFKQFANQHKTEYEQAMLQQPPSGNQRVPPPPSYHNCIQLAACGAKQALPMTPELPADLFTSCLTTPIQVALRWYVLQPSSKLRPRVTLDLIDKVPGQISDRRTMLGELNWIFTAVTDTIAWNTLPRDLFQKLFRQDLLVASLFRNFLLAERIMRSCDCTPISSPALPPTFQHPMWAAWDLALDLSLGQLPGVVLDGETFRHLGFFEEQLTAFQVWLELVKSVILASVFIQGKGAQLKTLQKNHQATQLSNANIRYITGLSNIAHTNEILDNILIPRVVGTPNHKKVFDYIKKELQKLQWHIDVDEFESETPHGPKTFKNIIATLNPESERYLVLACHYDSKYFENEVFVGATDSAVPCAMMLNLAATLASELGRLRTDARLNLKLVFFDGEEAFVRWGPQDSIYGARHLAERYHGAGRRDGAGEDAVSELQRIDVLVLLDLIGHKGTRFLNSFEDTQRWFLKLADIEDKLAQLGLLKNRNHRYFVRKNFFGYIEDDHIPFLEKDVPVLHLISNPFPNEWHTPADNRDIVDMNTVENLNKILRVFVVEYLNIDVADTNEEVLPEKEL